MCVEGASGRFESPEEIYTRERIMSYFTLTADVFIIKQTGVERLHVVAMLLEAN